MPKKCPACSSSMYENGYCRRCGFINRKLTQEEITNIDDKKQEKRYKKGGRNRCQI